MKNAASSPVIQINGAQPVIELPYQCKVINEGLDGLSLFLPYVCYMPEKDRLILLVTRRKYEAPTSETFHDQPMLMFSDDHGDTWSAPEPVRTGSGELQGAALSLAYLGNGKLMMLQGEHAGAWLLSRDYGEKWERLSASRGSIWDLPFVDVDPSTRRVKRISEQSYSGMRRWDWDPYLPGPTDPFSQGFLRFSLDEGRTWGEEIKIPQWLGVNEVTIVRAANGDLVAGCRTDLPKRFEQTMDEYAGLGVSISKDNGVTWSEVNMLYDWGRHHPSMVRLSTGELVMSYLVRRGYPDTPDCAFPQFGEEAIVSFDNGQTWDLDHKYILHKYQGSIDARDIFAWGSGPQNVTSALLPGDEIITIFGIGPHAGLGEEQHLFYPRDVGLVRWRINRDGLNNERTISNSPADSDLRNKFDVNPPSPPAQGRRNIATADCGATISASYCRPEPEFMMYDPYLFAQPVTFIATPAWVAVTWPDTRTVDEVFLNARELGDLLPPGRDWARRGHRLKFLKNSEWQDFPGFTEVTKAPGRNEAFDHTFKFEPLEVKGICLQLFSTGELEHAPVITRMEIIGQWTGECLGSEILYTV